MNILYCGDRHIADGLVISVLSLLKHIPESLSIYVFTMDVTIGDSHVEPLPNAVIAQLDARVKKSNPKSFVKCIDLSEEFQRDIPYANLKTRFTPCCMLRLYADLVPDMPDKILYLDTDVVCRQDCSDFYHQDMQNQEFIGVLDYYGRWFFRRKFWKSDYVNSGVLLMNLSKMRETHLLEKCRTRCRTRRMFMPDQSALNKLSTSKAIAPRQYNEQRKLKSNTVLQHFSTSFRFFPWIHIVSVKPWQIDKVHNILKIHEYDDVLDEYSAMRETAIVNGVS